MVKTVNNTHVKQIKSQNKSIMVCVSLFHILGLYDMFNILFLRDVNERDVLIAWLVSYDFKAGPSM